MISKSYNTLQILSTLIISDDLKTLEEIFKNCQRLESIKVWCGDWYLNEKGLLNVVTKFSPKPFHELKIDYAYNVQSELPSEDLESFFINWTNRTSPNPFSLIIININGYCTNSLETRKENMKIIEKYIKLGVIKKFKIKDVQYINDKK